MNQSSKTRRNKKCTYCHTKNSFSIDEKTIACKRCASILGITDNGPLKLIKKPVIHALIYKGILAFALFSGLLFLLPPMRLIASHMLFAATLLVLTETIFEAFKVGVLRSKGGATYQCDEPKSFRFGIFLHVVMLAMIATFYYSLLGDRLFAP